MTLYYKNLLSISWITCTAMVAASAPDAAEILKKADEVRNPANAYQLKIEVESTDGTSAVFDVKIKGGNKTLIRTIAPAKDRGRDLLMIGDDMWAYIPNLKRPVRVALQQKLSGEAANGDIARNRWYSDYEATIERDEGAAWVLLLTAKRKGLTYDKIRLWVRKNNSHPLKAEYLSLSGTPLKFVKFDNYRLLEGAERPALLIIEDAVQKQKTSRIIIKEMKSMEISDSVFRESQLGQP